MKTDAPDPFDVHFQNWKAEQEQPWMDLRYRLEVRNLKRHLGDRQLKILDAGGGNAPTALLLARAGHQVLVLDNSEQMLTDGRRTARQQQLSDRVEFHMGEIRQIPELLPQSSFDLVLCHNVIHYLEDLIDHLQALIYPLKPGGLFSVITVNRYSEIYKAAFRDQDLDLAAEKLDSGEAHAVLFDLPLRTFTEQELVNLVEQNVCRSSAVYGVRCVCDWLPNEPKYDPDYLENLEELEYRLADRFPHYLLARFYQIIAVKEQGDSLLGKLD